MKKRNVFLLGLLVILLAIGLVLAGCGDNGSGDNGGNDSSSNNSGGNDSGGNNSGGNNSDGNDSGGNNSGGNNSDGNSSGDNNSSGQDSGGNTFTPPKKADIEAFVENYRKDTKLMGGSAAVYIKSITRELLKTSVFRSFPIKNASFAARRARNCKGTDKNNQFLEVPAINTYTVDGNNITASPSPVPENAQVQVKFTVRTILSFDNLTMGERLNIDNFRVDLQYALKTWLKNQGFGSSNIDVTTGNTIFG